MKEFKAIVSAYRKIDFASRKIALATVVRVRGSSYRSPGARMLITDDGKWIGSISGGCLEGDALRKARQVMSENKSLTITYDTREESNQYLGIGLGCNGVIDVLIEPIDPTNSNNTVLLFEKVLESKGPVALATIFSPGDQAEKLWLTENNKSFSSISNKKLETLIEQHLAEIFISGHSEAKKISTGTEDIEIFIELIQPSVSLIIFGGGFDARPVSEMARSIGWNVTVTDECVAHIAPLFFPSADKLSLCHREYVDREFDITPYTACILMSHNYEYDRDVLKKLLRSPSPYIGILGPRKRFDKMIEEFKNVGINLATDHYHRIHSPIGLDIGAETPDEIAVSIIAEIQGKFSNRSGGFLKYRNAPIHKRDSKSDQVFKQVYLTNGSENKSATGG
jgi:xanthine dehydrogenase accessory factor